MKVTHDMIRERIDLAYADLAVLDARPMPDDAASVLLEVRQRGELVGRIKALEWLLVAACEGEA